MDFIFKQLAMNTAKGCAIAMLVALICGLVIAIVYRLGTDNPSKYMIITTLIMPAVVQTVIMLVNGSIGAGVAVAGAFSLVRFRSVPGTSRDICILFLAMAAGLASGMGYIWYSIMFTVIIAAVVFIVERIIPSEHSKNSRLLRILVPEDMDYNGLFDDIFGLADLAIHETCLHTADGLLSQNGLGFLDFYIGQLCRGFPECF